MSNNGAEWQRSPATHFQIGRLKPQVPESSLSRWQIEALQRFTSIQPILVSDDDRMSRLYYRALLNQTFGFGLLETWDPQESLRLCQERPVSLLISCLLKPMSVSTNGLMLVEQMRRNAATDHIPLLVISARSNAMDVALHAGADAFLTKPCHPDQILHQIWLLLRPRLL